MNIGFSAESTGLEPVTSFNTHTHSHTNTQTHTYACADLIILACSHTHRIGQSHKYPGV